VSALLGEYRGKPIEDAAKLAEKMAGLSPEDRRVILRIIANAIFDGAEKAHPARAGGA
jgi:hypothetical protein